MTCRHFKGNLMVKILVCDCFANVIFKIKGAGVCSLVPFQSETHLSRSCLIQQPISVELDTFYFCQNVVKSTRVI